MDTSWKNKISGWGDWVRTVERMPRIRGSGWDARASTFQVNSVRRGESALLVASLSVALFSPAAAETGGSDGGMGSQVVWSWSKWCHDWGTAVASGSFRRDEVCRQFVRYLVTLERSDIVGVFRLSKVSNPASVSKMDSEERSKMCHGY